MIICKNVLTCDGIFKGGFGAIKEEAKNLKIKPYATSLLVLSVFRGYAEEGVHHD